MEDNVNSNSSLVELVSDTTTTLWNTMKKRYQQPYVIRAQETRYQQPYVIRAQETRRAYKIWYLCFVNKLLGIEISN